MSVDTTHPVVWETIWNDVQANSPLRRRRIRSDEERVQRWDRMAQGFAQRTERESAGKKREKILAWLREEGALKPGIRILDVGGGPGNWALPLAETAAHVTVVEPSSAMVAILEKRIKDQNRDNITVVQKRWEDVNLDLDGLAKPFDLVFASMTPGVNNSRTLTQLIRASKAHCYMSGFSGLGRMAGVKDLWPLIFRETLEDNPGDIIYPFNLLYAMGYKPRLTFTHWDRSDDMAPDEAVNFLMNFLWDYTEPTTEIRDIVTKHVDARTENGMFITRQPVCQGHMLWEVNRP